MKKKQIYLDIPRLEPVYQPVAERVSHYNEFLVAPVETDILRQAERCMTCGVPFCHNVGCPLGNQIPDTNTFVFEERWRDASDVLHNYDNFPEFTGRICPALCEASCVHGINSDAVTIRQIELEIVERAWKSGWIVPQPARFKSGKKAAVVGSGPAGLAAAQQLSRAGHEVVVFEKEQLPGGILRYGIPDFKLEKWVIDRRIKQMEAENVFFETGATIGYDLSLDYLRRRFDALVLAGGAMEPRDIDIHGRKTTGIYQAMQYLIASNYAVWENRRSDIDAKGKHVVIIGGGDTGADCLGTALRQGAADVAQIEIMPKPPEGRSEKTPWPQWPTMLRSGTSHKEGGTRRWSVTTKKFVVTKDKVTGIECAEVDWVDGKPVEKAGTAFTLKADIVLLAMGFVHPKHDNLLESLGIKYDARGNVEVDPNTRQTNINGVFAAGDMQSGASLVVRAINSGRLAAMGADTFLRKV